MMLKNKVALVTGGTSGIGRATAIAFGAAGAKVVFSGRRDAEGEKTALAALDYAKQGIRINSINPGFIATEMNDRMGTTVDALASTVPMGRVGQAAEIAQAVIFLCSDAASYITEQPLAIADYIHLS